jgi:hypothetical protein
MEEGFCEGSSLEESCAETPISCSDISGDRLDFAKILFFRVIASNKGIVSSGIVAQNLSSSQDERIKTLDISDYLAAAKSLLEDGRLEILTYFPNNPAMTTYRISFKNLKNY